MFAGIYLMVGCAGISDRPAFVSIKEDVNDRTGLQLHWHTGQKEDEEQVAQAVDQLLKEPLNVDSAVQIALLNNRRIQALYQDLRISRADLVQAGLLRNPGLGASALFPVDGGSAEVKLSVTQHFLDIFLIPLRKQVSSSLFEETKIQVTGRILDLAYRTRVAFYNAQADSQRLEVLGQKLLVAELSYEFAQRLRQAGNITELAFHQQRDVYEKAKMEVRRGESEAHESREALNRLMGAWGGQILWKIETPFSENFKTWFENEPDLKELESEVLEASLDLADARQRILTAGRQLGITKATALVPELELGIEAERDDDWYIGPTLAFPLPLFNQGQAHMVRGRARLRIQQEQYAALAVEIRSTAREWRHRFDAAKDIAGYYLDVIIPLRERIAGETELQYNAMQIGPIELLSAKDQQLAADLEFIDAMKKYRIAHAAIEQLLCGRMPVISDAMENTADQANKH
jgi:outer membrane protein, heavy metal efflux system